MPITEKEIVQLLTSDSYLQCSSPVFPLKAAWSPAVFLSLPFPCLLCRSQSMVSLLIPEKYDPKIQFLEDKDNGFVAVPNPIQRMLNSP